VSGPPVGIDPDTAFVAAFEDTTLPPERFHHADHIRLAWLLLAADDLPAALDRFRRGLRRYAAALGKADLYHETITVAYVLLIHERREGGPAGEPFEDFARRNPDLLAWRPGVLDRYYRPETLASERARRVFLLPDRLAAPPGSSAAA